MRILFVCTGNTCRSPMAEAIFNHIAESKNYDDIAFSRGTNVFFEEPANPKAVNALKNLGIDNFSHTSSQISIDDADGADLILAMTSSHKMALKSAFPKCSSKIFTLNEKAYGVDSPICDPYGQGQDVYDRCAAEITEAIENLFGKIRNNVQNG